MKRLLPVLFSLLFGVNVLCQTTPAAADEPEPVHRYGDDRNPPPVTKVKIVLLGAAVTSAFYLPVMGSSYIWSDRRGASDMRIPVAGPWMAMAQTRLCKHDPEQDNCSNFLRVTSAVLLVLDGIGQAGGVGIMLEGLFLRTARESMSASSQRMTMPLSLGGARSGHASHPLSFGSGDFQVTPVPMVAGSSDLGLSFAGTF